MGHGPADKASLIFLSPASDGGIADPLTHTSCHPFGKQQLLDVVEGRTQLVK